MKRYGLIGRTLKHSFSKTYFTQKFADSGIDDCVYENFELSTIDEFSLLFSAHPDLKGLNVTIPYKEEVLPFLHVKTEVVEETGACNCIKIEGERLTGYNTDVVGFRNSLEKRLQPHHTQALVLGTGGAAKAIQYVLQSLGIDYRLVSRSKGEGMFGYEEITEAVLAACSLIINTTPLGMYPNFDEAPPIPYQFVTPTHFLFDIIYNPETTKFLEEGKKRGAQICNGYEMLIGQAEESWRIWNER